MIPSSEILVLAGFAISVVAAAAAALVVHSERVRSTLLVGIVVIVAAAAVLYVRAQRSADTAFRERVAQEVGQRLRNEQEFQQAVDEAVQRRLRAERSRQAEVDSLARERVAAQLAEDEQRETAEYRERVRRDAIRADEEARRASAARAGEEQRRALGAHRARLIGRWLAEDWAGCRSYMTFAPNGGFRSWIEGGRLCTLGFSQDYSRFEVVSLNQVRVSGVSGSMMYRIGFNADGELVHCGVDLGAASRWSCPDVRFKKVAGR